MLMSKKLFYKFACKKNINVPKTLIVNNKKYELDLKGHETLLEVIREQLNLTGTKSACEESECGACTVLINGKAVLACTILACAVEDEEIITIAFTAIQLEHTIFDPSGNPIQTKISNILDFNLKEGSGI